MNNRVKKLVHRKLLQHFILGGLLVLLFQAALYLLNVYDFKESGFYSPWVIMIISLIALLGVAAFIGEEFHIRRGGRYWFTLLGGPVQPHQHRAKRK